MGWFFLGAITVSPTLGFGPLSGCCSCCARASHRWDNADMAKKHPAAISRINKKWRDFFIMGLCSQPDRAHGYHDIHPAVGQPRQNGHSHFRLMAPRLAGMHIRLEAIRACATLSGGSRSLDNRRNRGEPLFGRYLSKTLRSLERERCARQERQNEP